MTTETPVTSFLRRVHARHAALGEGELATYIPELARADPAWFGISMVTTDGAVYEVGDTRHEFSIQSISKPFTFAMALDHLGASVVLGRVGVEPTGDAFNSISLDPATGMPSNPMINAGAITVTGLLVERHGDTARRSAPRHLRRLRRTWPVGRRGGVRVRTGHRAPQPRHRPPLARFGRAARRPRARARRLPPTVLRPDRHPRSRGHGSHAGERWRQPVDRPARRVIRGRRRRPDRDGKLRHV